MQDVMLGVIMCGLCCGIDEDKVILEQRRKDRWTLSPCVEGVKEIWNLLDLVISNYGTLLYVLSS